ncbi:MAG: response regulator transcription factor [Actinomycetota bacterium]
MSDGRCVLVVDDEPIVREVLSRYLAREGYVVSTAADGAEALDAFERTTPDLVLLDLMLPSVDGFEVFRAIRRSRETPVIMLTAKGEESDRIVGLELGADDYVTKPFSPREVVLRVDALLRRTAPVPGREPLVFGTLEIDPGRREALLDGRRVDLTRKEFDLLYHFGSHPGVVFTRTRLLEEVWDFAFDGDPATVTVHIRRLRQKIEADPSEPRRLVTVWGVGYRFEPV